MSHKAKNELTSEAATDGLELMEFEEILLSEGVTVAEFLQFEDHFDAFLNGVSSNIEGNGRTKPTFGA